MFIYLIYCVPVFTDSRLASQAFIFFLAGFETSSTTLSFCLYELAVNPDIQIKLRDEIDATLHKFGGITYDAVQSMRYLSQVIDGKIIHCTTT
jgi:cytochrome P450 family 6